MLKYTVKDVVCDYGLFENDKLLIILNSRANALLIKEILDADLQHEVHRGAITAYKGMKVYRIFLASDDEGTPCSTICKKPGDRVDGVCKGLYEVYEGTSSKYKKNDDWAFMCDNCPLAVEEDELKDESDIERYKNHYGRDFFPTRKSAEQALKHTDEKILRGYIR